MPDQFKRAGICSPGDDKDTVALQMGDLLAGEVLRQSRGQGAGEPWKVITARRNIVFKKAPIHPESLQTLASERMRKEIMEEAGRLLKRIYKDKEQSNSLAQDINDFLRRRQIVYLHFDQLSKLFESNEDYLKFAGDEKE